MPRNPYRFTPSLHKPSRQQAFLSRKKGFTIVEVMLVFAITGLMLVGVLGSTYLSISAQRYNDSLRNFAEYMRSMYNEALAPQSIASTDTQPIGNDTERSILGKIIVFGLAGKDAGDGGDPENIVYSATLTGSTNLYNKTNPNFLAEIGDEGNTKIAIFCGDDKHPSSVQSYTPLWQASFAQATGVPAAAKFPDQFKGTIIIARTPTSATLHTIFSTKTYDITGGNCNSASSQLKNDLKTASGFSFSDVGICVRTAESRVSREVRIAADGRNSSAVWVRPDDGDNKCVK